MYTLENFYLGQSDGKKEAIYRKDFENFFYNYNDSYQKAMKENIFLILGRKGTGKSILAEFIKKKSEEQPNLFCEVCSYKEFKFHELIHLKNNNIEPNEYISIWEWVLLLELAKLCLNDESLTDFDEQQTLSNFIEDNFFSLNLDAEKIVEVTKQKNINGEVLKIGAGYHKSTTYETGSYLNYLERLKEVVFKLLKKSSNSYKLIYDEIDDKFRNESVYKNSITSLLKAVDKLNLKMLSENIEGKIMVLLRTDIYNLLNDPDLNKLSEDNAITIDWGTKVAQNSSLVDLILNKVQVSVSELSEYKRDELFISLFPQKIKGITPERFLLERTFFRPRDVIAYLNYIIRKYPKSKYFGWKAFLDLEDKYSEYFFREIRNEISGHKSDEFIDQGALLLKQFNKFHFDYKEIKPYYEKNKNLYPDIDLEEMLKTFFDFGVLGNKWYNEFKQKNYYSWAYRDNKATVDFDKTFVVHLGLRKELSL